LFDKVHAVPQMAKRAEYKSAADMYMEKTMTDPDREQLTQLTHSWYDTATDEAAKNRHLTQQQVQAAFEASPQFAEEARDRHLIDRIGYDDDALAAASGRAGKDAKQIKISDYIRARDNLPTTSANIAVIEAAGEINDGTAQGDLFTGSSGIASDDLSAAIRQATNDKDIKAIIFRVDSPGGSVTASDQILDAVRKAQAKGKPVVVSMGSLAASGGYYVSTSANSIVAEPGTLTGSIGVLTGKLSFNGTADLVGVKMDEVAIGKNTLMDSINQPFTPDQWTELNHEADVIYADFLGKVAAGRKLPLEQVQQIARGRVWTGADGKTHGLVNELGGFWTAANVAAGLGKVSPDSIAFRVYPKPKGFFDNIQRVFGGTETSMHALGTLETLASLPEVEQVVTAVHDAPRKGIELRAPNLQGLLTAR
jgi:protease-4